MGGRSFDLAVLGLGVAAVSSAAVLIRQAAAPALVIAAYRLTLASLPLLAYAGARRLAVLPPGGERRRLTLLAGLFLALHFGFWIASVQQTSVVTSVALVTSQPLFVALAAGPLLGERPAAGAWAGIGLAAAGALVMVSDDLGRGRDTLLGDLYAVLGAVFAAAYILCGRRVRTAGSAWLPYVAAVYGVAAGCLLAAVLVAGHGLGGYSGETFAYFLLLALVPQLIGHTAINRSLGYLPAAAVAIAILGEPVGATLLAAAFLDETPTLLQGLGAAVLLAGVYLGLRSTGPTLPAIAPD
jgi:drug/metabolite transporter (DMT)-like permease